MPCDIALEREGDRVTLRVTGELDRNGAWSLRELLQEEKDTRDLTLDFSLVRDFSDIAVAVLARALSELSGPCQLRGLRQHQLRIFRYCGVEVDDEEAARSEGPPSARHHRA